jgi:hypothetical protein
MTTERDHVRPSTNTRRIALAAANADSSKARRDSCAIERGINFGMRAA